MENFDEYIDYSDLTELMKEKLSTRLAISLEELESIEPRLEGDINSEGFINSYTVFFKPNASLDTLSKIKGLQSGNTCSIRSWDIYEDDSPELSAE